MQSSSKGSVTGLEAELLSAYIDGELSPTAKAEVLERLKASPALQGELERQERLRRLLHSDPEPQFQEAMDRVLSRIAASERSLPLWRRSIRVPVPALAGGMAAVLMLAFALVLTAARAPVGRLQITTAPSGMKQIQVEAPIQELESLLRSFESSAASREVIIQLPAGSQIQSIGEPVLLREHEHDGGAFR